MVGLDWLTMDRLGDLADSLGVKPDVLYAWLTTGCAPSREQ